MVFPDDLAKFWPRDLEWSNVEYLDLSGLRDSTQQFYSNHSANIVSMKMRRIPICSEVEVIDMSSNQNLEVCQESRIERMKKLLSSPLTKKKTSIQGKMFGSSLDALAHREPQPQHEVPFIITRICQYIEKHGMTHEGIFRISGNARLIEKLKTSFDHAGDAPLESEGDVASAGALLKLFLRELPEPVIPSAAQAAFLEAARENFQNKENCVRVLKCLVQHLPEEHFAVLKYLIHFLHRIAELEDQNRMSASSLGIVFGPNLFRVSDDFSGLKDQAVTNHIATTFIKNYEAIFEDNSNELPADEDLRSPRIDPKEYEPLSVLIPPVDDTVLAMQAQETIQSEKRVPVLMVDSFSDAGKRGSIDGRLNGDGSISNGTPPRRKRKERKFSGDDISGPLRSSSEERPSMDPNEEQKYYLGGERIRRCSSHDEMRNIDENQTVETDGTHKQSRRKSSAEVVGVNLTLSADGLSIATINQELSPHPPKPKRRELESTSHHSGSSSCSSVVDPQSDQDLPNNNQISTPLVDHHDIHEMQRSAERLAPFQRGPNPRTRRTSSRSSRFRKSQSFESDDDTAAGSADEKQWKRSQSSQWKNRDSGADFDSPMDTRAPGDENQESRRATDRHNGVLKSHGKKHHRSLERKDSEGKASHPLGELPPDDQLLYGSVSRRESLDEQEDWKNESFPSFDGDDAAIPHLDLNTLHEHGDGEEPIPSEHRFSWPLTKPPQDDTALLSPSAPYMRKANSYEAPQSPSAFKNYFSHRSSLQFDPSLPPSPPVEQDDLMKSTMKEDEAVAVNVKQLTKKMHSYKKKIKLFEEAFELEHGYRPSHAEKMNYPEAKKMLQEFNKIRKELRQLKEEGHTGELMSPHKEYPSMKTQRLSDGDVNKPTVATSLTKAQQYLNENRRIHQRPQEFEKMTKDQVQDEKVAIQKALLQFESVHGRPVTKVDRDTMRELYERYRSVKRLVRANTLQSGGSSISSSATMKGKELVMMGTELQPILEHVAMDFTSPQHRRLPDENAKFSEASEDQENIAEVIPAEEVVAEDATKEEFVKSSIATGGIEADDKNEGQKSCNLHELPLSELLRQLQQARVEKRKLKKSVRDFEDDFQRKTGRRAQKEDRSSVEKIYSDYKHIKARLKLLDALVTKHEHHMMI